MADFEDKLREAIKKNFPDSQILGCYFHFIKNLYNKLKLLGLTTKKNIRSSLKFLFFFKIFPFLKNENKEEYIKDIINYYITESNTNLKKYVLFIKYFLKTWYGKEIMSYETLNNKDIKFRTDNPVESFHKKLNSFIKSRKPKLSYFVEHLLELIKETYDSYIINLNSVNMEKRAKFSISQDIIDFLTEIQFDKLKFMDLFQLDKEDNDIIYNIGKKLLILLFDIE